MSKLDHPHVIRTFDAFFWRADAKADAKADAAAADDGSHGSSSASGVAGVWIVEELADG